MTTERIHRINGRLLSIARQMGLGERRERKNGHVSDSPSGWLFSAEEVERVTEERNARRLPRPTDETRTIRLGKRASFIVVAKELGLGEHVQSYELSGHFVSPAEMAAIRAHIYARRAARRKCDVRSDTRPVSNAELRAIESFREELAAGRERRDAWRYACGWTGHDGPMPAVEVAPVDRSALIAEAAQRRDGDHRESRRVMAPTGTVRAA
jgi:hypothetical protein